MGWYFAFIGLALVQWFLFYPNGKIPLESEVATRHNRKFAIRICVELILFAGLRATWIGADTGVYLRALNYYASFPKGEILGAKLVYPFDFEAGYFLLTKLCALVGMNETQFLLLIAVIIYVPLFRFFYKYSENPLLSLTIWFAFGFFGYSLGIFRQTIAISIILCGFSYIKDRQMVRYLLVVVLASTCHLAALVAIPLYFFYQIDVKKLLVWVLIAEVVVFVWARTILLFVLRFIPQYSGYINGRYDLQGRGNTMLVVLNILLLAGYYIYCKKEKETQDSAMHICVNAMMVAVVLQAMAHAMAIFGRLIPYYSTYMVLLIPKCISRYFDQKSRVFATAIVFVLMMVIFYILHIGNEKLCPYQFIWEV